MSTEPDISQLIRSIDPRRAAAALSGRVHRTPVLTSRYLNGLSGATLFFKCENFQKTGSFKARGAMHAVLSLDEGARRRGVVTHSSGNHGQALAWAAAEAGISASVVMPRGAPTTKVAAVREYGATVEFCEPTPRARQQTADEVVRRHGLELIHPYNDRRIIAGQATAALELLAEVPNLDAVIAPVGGGGLLSGTALAAAAQDRPPRVFAAEPAAADDAYRSLRARQRIELNETNTIADGLRTSLGPLTFAIIAELVEDILLVEETEIVRAMRIVWERMKLVIEPSAAVPVAALIKQPSPLRGCRVGVILSGGNVDLDRLPWLTAPRA